MESLSYTWKMVALKTSNLASFFFCDKSFFFLVKKSSFLYSLLLVIDHLQ
jgi:hypothetical protein